MKKKDISILKRFSLDKVTVDVDGVPVDEWLFDGYIERNQSGYSITVKGHLLLMTDEGKKNPELLALTKITEGQAKYFLANKKGEGISSYSFREAVMYLGYWKALENAYKYLICTDVKKNNSYLVKDMTRLFATGFKFSVSVDGKEYIFYTDKKGDMLCEEKHFREWEAELISKSINSPVVNHWAVFLHTEKDTDKCLTFDHINGME